MADTTINPAANPAAAYAPGESRLTTKTLGQEDFLKLVVAQFTNQDPTNPKSDTDYIGQMANFSNLEMTKSMSREFSMLRASSMLGRQVEVQPDPITLTGDLPDPISGIVSEIRPTSATDATPLLLIDGRRYTLQQVLSITTPPPPAPVPAKVAQSVNQ